MTRPGIKLTASRTDALTIRPNFQSHFFVVALRINFKPRGILVIGLVAKYFFSNPAVPIQPCQSKQLLAENKVETVVLIHFIVGC